uniref:Uncharacterized protein n=1 Tax=Arundo donax TaxID=35708 RepID=A0A0A8ZX04_ARUDO
MSFYRTILTNLENIENG